MSTVYLKDKPKGIDKVVNDLNEQLFNDLTIVNGWEGYNAYHRAYKNPTQNGIVAEVFDKDDKDNISLSDCRSQLSKWAEAQAEQLAEKTPQGQRLAYLKALQEKAEDLVKEASISDELTASLDNLFLMVGVSWERKLPQLPRK